MTLVPFIGFAVVALLAIGFAIFALRKYRAKSTALLAGAIALFILGIGGGTYWMVGRPNLATRAAQGLATRDINGLIPFLITRVRKEPGDLQAWIYLARAYMTAGDAVDAAPKAYGRAVTVAAAGATLTKMPNWIRPMAKRMWRPMAGSAPKPKPLSALRWPSIPKTRRRVFSWARRGPSAATGRAR